ncbi:hypothetical protein QR680_004824 [Steinernema hermaphroditum]|uniref:glucuronosyltransferase n=1 Tax=Steinernema hermaphroditum TaxID=289476 RepID=A0AA39HS87_9BILA|nr:hypothetical protein QR680_004824 [Steinernema hermaphroditum]
MLLLLLFFVSFLSSVRTSAILFANLWNSRSHAGTVLPLAQRLVQRGHNVTIYTPVLRSFGKLEGVNTVEATMPDSYDRSLEAVIFKDVIWHSDYTPFKLRFAFEIGGAYVEHVWNLESFQNVRNHKWDLVIANEMLATPAFSIALDQNRRFGAKILPSSSRLKGLWRNPVVSPNYYLRHKKCRYSPGDFFDRVETAVDLLMEYYILEHLSAFWMAKTLSLFGIAHFEWSDIYNETQLTFSDYPDRYSWPTTVSNQMVYTGAFCTGRVPEDLEAFMSDSTKKGLIYVAFGSMVVDAFFEMFRHFPDYIFIFSFKLKGYPVEKAGPNVKVLSWAPQREIIAHKRTVLFFTHGGLKSLKEAICAETPLLVLPFFADQIPNAVNMRHLGFAESLIKTELSTEVMVAQIRKMVTNRAYKEKIKKIKAIFVDRVMDPQEEGVFWTERILRSSRGLTFPIRGSTMTYVEILNLDVLALASLTLPLLLWRLLEGRPLEQLALQLLWEWEYGIISSGASSCYTGEALILFWAGQILCSSSVFWWQR